MANKTQKTPPQDKGPAHRPFFTRFSQAVAKYAGKPVTFFCALMVIVVWGATGPIFGFNDTWQLIINTSTTIVTFLMVFLIQNSQNRDTAALQIKLDELIARMEGPRNALLGLEDLDEESLERLHTDYAHLADEARAEVEEEGTASASDHVIEDICDTGDVPLHASGKALRGPAGPSAQHAKAKPSSTKLRAKRRVASRRLGPTQSGAKKV